ncbi:LPD25 domain-containing protein [Bacillus sp. T33-2]|uniref:LPD25 domain-containing protein n=1 Tax=Bacillus sp. T33-2 TaxID=2054168 RepID=UPI000C7670BC|nr:LPD25 domain-containing protein [Bacillus sp. T33-2]PLR99611.1 hypothetical protein CVD19_00680 [Bacillus sp. T33-2]
MSNYYSNQESVANVYVGLVERGWNCFGYRADQSDSMTDYYSPARWEGVAEKDGYILLVDVYSTSESGKKGYPVFSHVNPKRNNWHIEKDGEIIAKGNGAFKCSGFLFGHEKEETMEKVNKFIDRIEKNIKPSKETVNKNKQTQVKKEVKMAADAITCEMNLNNDLNGVELKFSGIPTETVRNELKSNGFRYSKYNKVWYCQKSEKAIMFAESIVSIYADIAKDIEAGEEYILNPEKTIEELQEVQGVFETPEQNENISLIGRKVFGQWGVMAGWNNGIITDQTDYSEVIVNWEEWEGTGDGQKHRYDIKDLIIVNENTSLDPIGIYLMPEEVTAEPITEEIKEPVTTSEGKITVESIQFVWSESNLITDETTVSTFAEAEQMIKRAASKDPDNGCYDKTKFLITWSDGQTYEGRIDIVRSDMFKANPLKQHITEHCMFYSGQYCPSYMTEAEYKAHIDYSKQEDYKQFLDTYSLEDDKQLIRTNNNDITDNKGKGKVLDFNSRFKQKQEQQETENMTDHFLENVLPFLNQDELFNLQAAYKSNNEEELNNIWQQLMLKTAVRRAKKEFLKQN